MGSRDVRVRDEYSSIHWVLASIPLANDIGCGGWGLIGLNDFFFWKVKR